MTWLKDSNTHLNKTEQDNSKSDKSDLLCEGCLVKAGALRQYQHNNCSGFVFGYDVEITDEVFNNLENSNFEMRVVLFEINRMVRRGYVNLGENLNYQLMAMFSENKNT